MCSQVRPSSSSPPDCPGQLGIAEQSEQAGFGDERLLGVEQHLVADLLPPQCGAFGVGLLLDGRRPPDPGHSVGEDFLELLRSLAQDVLVLREPDALSYRAVEVLRPAKLRPAPGLQQPLHRSIGSPGGVRTIPFVRYCAIEDLALTILIPHGDQIFIPMTAICRGLGPAIAPGSAREVADTPYRKVDHRHEAAPSVPQPLRSEPGILLADQQQSRRSDTKRGQAHAGRPVDDGHRFRVPA